MNIVKEVDKINLMNVNKTIHLSIKYHEWTFIVDQTVKKNGQIGYAKSTVIVIGNHGFDIVVMDGHIGNKRYTV